MRIDAPCMICIGLAPYFRLSYATSEQNLREALKRIAEACRELS
jgi:aspartate aminotransferase